MHTQRVLILLGVLVTTLAVPGTALADLNAGLVAYYPLNGNGNDVSGNGNHGSVVGADPGADRFGNPARAYLFGNNPAHGAQASDYIQIADSATLRPQNGITLSAWIDTSNPAGRSIVGKQFGSGQEDSYLLWYNAGTLWFTFYPFGGSSINAPIPSLGAWHHVAGTWDGATMRLYVDGNQVSASAFAGPMQYDDSPVVIGADNDSADDLPDDGWDGLIDDVRIYNRALSPDEFRDLVRSCILELTPSYVGSTVHLNFTLGTGAAATWNLWAVVQSGASRLLSLPIPVIDPPASFDVPLGGVPHLGVIGFLTTATGGAGIVCSDWSTVDTGQ
jgi:concanavalin A-like lectin/glucanase superfamily protein